MTGDCAQHNVDDILPLGRGGRTQRAAKGFEGLTRPLEAQLPWRHPLTIRNMAKTASFIAHVFEKLWGAGTDTPRLMQNLRAVTRTLIENPVPGNTFAEIPLLYSNEIVRAKMVSNLSNEAIISYWEDYERKPQRERGIYLESFLNKVGAFIDEPMIRNVFSQSRLSGHWG